MNFKELKKGDKLDFVQFGNGIFSATVIENFPEKEVVFIKVNFSWLMKIKTVVSYYGYNLYLAKKKGK